MAVNDTVQFTELKKTLDDLSVDVGGLNDHNHEMNTFIEASQEFQAKTESSVDTLRRDVESMKETMELIRKRVNAIGNLLTKQGGMSKSNGRTVSPPPQRQSRKRTSAKKPTSDSTSKESTKKPVRKSATRKKGQPSKPKYKEIMYSKFDDGYMFHGNTYNVRSFIKEHGAQWFDEFKGWVVSDEESAEYVFSHLKGKLCEETVNGTLEALGFEYEDRNEDGEEDGPSVAYDEDVEDNESPFTKSSSFKKGECQLSDSEDETPATIEEDEPNI